MPTFAKGNAADRAEQTRNIITMENNQIVIYQTEDGQTRIDVRMENETGWRTRAGGNSQGILEVQTEGKTPSTRTISYFRSKSAAKGDDVTYLKASVTPE